MSERSAGRSRRRTRSPYVVSAASSGDLRLAGMGRLSSQLITSSRSNRSLSPATGAGKSACRVRHWLTAALVTPASPATCAPETVVPESLTKTKLSAWLLDVERALASARESVNKQDPAAQDSRCRHVGSGYIAPETLFGCPTRTSLRSGGSRPRLAAAYERRGAYRMLAGRVSSVWSGREASSRQTILRPPTVLRASRWSLRGHERFQSRIGVHVYVVACLGDLECVGSPHGSSAYSLEVVRSMERGKPPWTEGKEDCGRVAEWHTARDAEGSTSSADGDRGHVTEQERGTGADGTR